MQCGALTMWLLLETFGLPKQALFKADPVAAKIKVAYLLFAPFIISSRAYLNYNTAEQVILGYLFGSLNGTVVFVFVRNSTLIVDQLRAGLNPLWAKIGLKNNLSSAALERATLQDKINIALLKHKYEPIKQAKEELRQSYENLTKMTKPLFEASKSTASFSGRKLK